MQLKYSKEEVIKLYNNLTRKEFANKLDITMYKASQLVKQLNLKKKRGPKRETFGFEGE